MMITALPLYRIMRIGEALEQRPHESLTQAAERVSTAGFGRVDVAELVLKASRFGADDSEQILAQALELALRDREVPAVIQL